MIVSYFNSNSEKIFQQTFMVVVITRKLTFSFSFGAFGPESFETAWRFKVMMPCVKVSEVFDQNRNLPPPCGLQQYSNGFIDVGMMNDGLL